MENIPNIEGGKFRNNDVSIKNSDHTPISFLEVENEIENMFKWMNRNVHKFNPITLCAIIHHWLVWIHPFTDGNGRVTRLFTNFYLLQKGYPEIVIKIGDRDKYYDSLINADGGDITELVELFSDKLRQTVNVYEEFFNEYDRQKAWIKKFKDLGNEQYEKTKETYSFQYEVWKNQISVFKALVKENSVEFKEFSNKQLIEAFCGECGYIYDRVSYDRLFRTHWLFIHAFEKELDKIKYPTLYK